MEGQTILNYPNCQILLPHLKNAKDSIKTEHKGRRGKGMPRSITVWIAAIFCIVQASSMVHAQQLSHAELEAKALFPIVIENEDQSTENCMIRDSFPAVSIIQPLVAKYIGENIKVDIETPTDWQFAEILPSTIFKSFGGCAVHNEVGFQEDIKFKVKSQGFVTAKYEVYSFSFPVFNKNYDRALVVVVHQGLKAQLRGGQWSEFEVDGERTLVVLKKQANQWSEVTREQI